MQAIGLGVERDTLHSAVRWRHLSLSLSLLVGCLSAAPHANQYWFNRYDRVRLFSVVVVDLNFSNIADNIENTLGCLSWCRGVLSFILLVVIFRNSWIRQSKRFYRKLFCDLLLSLGWFLSVNRCPALKHSSSDYEDECPVTSAYRLY